MAFPCFHFANHLSTDDTILNTNIKQSVVAIRGVWTNIFIVLINSFRIDLSNVIYAKPTDVCVAGVDLALDNNFNPAQSAIIPKR